MSKSNYRINQEQREHLHDRIASVRHRYDHLPRTKAVIAAEKVLRDFKTKKQEHEHAASKAWSERCKKAREAVAFMSAEEALAEVKKLEAEAAKNRADDRDRCVC